VRNKESDVFHRHAVESDRLLGDLRQHPYSNLEYFVPLHLEEVTAILQGLRRRHVTGSETGLIEQVQIGSVGVHVRRQNPLLAAARLEHHRAGSVTEKHTGVSVLPVDDTRKRLSTDHQGLPDPAAFDLACSHAQRVDETAASG